MAGSLCALLTAPTGGAGGALAGLAVATGGGVAAGWPRLLPGGRVEIAAALGVLWLLAGPHLFSVISQSVVRSSAAVLAVAAGLTSLTAVTPWQSRHHRPAASADPPGAPSDFHHRIR